MNIQRDNAGIVQGLAVGLLLGMVAVTPWWFGGVLWQTQFWLLCTAVALAALDVGATFRSPERGWLSTLQIAVMAGILLGILQLLPVGAGVARWWAPEARRVRAEFGGKRESGDRRRETGGGRLTNDEAPKYPDTQIPKTQVPETQVPKNQVAKNQVAKTQVAKTQVPKNQVSTDPQNYGPADLKTTGVSIAATLTRSISPASTRGQVGLLLLAATVLWVAARRVSQEQMMLGALVVMTACGAALTLFGLAQKFAWNRKLYWIVELTQGGSPFGPFVNRNNAGGFLNLCLACGVGWLVWNVAKGGDRSEETGRRRQETGRRQENRSGSTSHSPSATSAPEKNSTTSEQLEESNSQSTSEGKPQIGSESTSHLPSATSAPEKNSTNPEELEQEPAQQAQRTKTGVGDWEENRAARRTRRRSGGHGTRRTRQSRRAVYVRHRSGDAMGFETHAYGDGVSNWLANLSGDQILASGGIAIIAVGVLATISRGSIVALVAAAGVTLVALLLRRGSRGGALGVAVVGIAAVALTAWLGHFLEIEARFATIWDDAGMVSNGRLPNWAEALSGVPLYWGWGSGLDTYRFYCEPLQERFLGSRWHYHAENQYLQALTDAGVAGALLLALALTSAWACVVTLFRAGGRANVAAAAMGTFALSSQMVGGAFDFGLYIPANMMLMAMVCGVVAGRTGMREEGDGRRETADGGRRTANGEESKRTQESEDRRQETVSGGQTYRPPVSLVGMPIKRDTAFALGMLLVVGTALSAVEFSRAAGVERATRKADVALAEDQREAAVIDAAITGLQDALQRRWDDAEAHATLSELLIKRYRVGVADELQRTQPWIESPIAWEQTSLWETRQALRRLERDGRAIEAEQLRAAPLLRRYLEPAWRHALWARAACPWIPYVHFRLAEMCAVVGDEPDVQAHLNRAMQISPGNAELWYWTALLKYELDDQSAAFAAWQRSMQLSPQFEAPVLAELEGDLPLETIIRDVLPQSPAVMLRMAQRHAARADGEADARSAARYGLELMGEETGDRSQETGDRRPETGVGRMTNDEIPKYPSTQDASVRDPGYRNRTERQTHTPTDPPIKEGEWYYVRAGLRHIWGAQDKALADLEQAVRLDRTQTAWQFELATWLLAAERFEEAHQFALACVRSDPRSRTYQDLVQRTNAARVRGSTRDAR